MRHPITEADKAEIVRRYKAGEPAELIAPDFHRTVKPILRIVRLAGAEVRNIGDYFRGKQWVAARRIAEDKRPPSERKLRPVRTRQQWKESTIGNRSISSHGYVRINIGGRRQYEHILIAEKVLGRALKKDERVHHINCDRSDNRPENLLICTHAYHLALHARMRRHPYWSQFDKGTSKK